MTVRAWMTPKPVTIVPDERLSVARERMDAGGFRRLPVVDEAGRLLGMLTDRDLRQHHGHLADTRVTGAMVEPALTIEADAAIGEAAALLLTRRIGGLPVVERGALVGIVTATDLLRGFVAGAPSAAERARR